MIHMIDQFLNSQDIYFQLARFIIVIVLGTLVTRTALMPFTRRAMARKGSDVKAKHSMENLVGLIGLFITFVVALQAGDFGNLVTVLGTLAAALTVAIGFGMRDQVSSVVAGIFIHTDNPFVKGDYIEFDEFEGVVKEIKLRTTVLNGNNDEKQIVPNNLLTTNVVKNRTKGRGTRSVLEVQVDSKHMEKASEILMKATEDQDEILSSPSPKIGYKSVEDGKIVVRMNYWLRDSERVKDVRSQVLKTFVSSSAEEGIFDQKED